LNVEIKDYSRHICLLLLPIRDGAEPGCHG
jgi:hypothetical protein